MHQHQWQSLGKSQLSLYFVYLVYLVYLVILKCRYPGWTPYA